MAASLAVPTAHAVVGSPVADGSYAFTAKLDIGGGQRGCSGVLVDASWLVTAAGCFADTGRPASAGAPPQKTTATIGRTDLTTSAGQVDDVVEIVPHADRDVVLARLARPVLDVVPVPVAAGAPVSGETLRVTGYGRTKDEWVPDRLQTAALSVASVDATTLGLAAKTPADAGLCKGDTGGPVFREGDGGRAELAGIASTSWQAGCFGSDETRTGAVGSRLDDIGPWIRETVSQGTDSRFTWRSLAAPDQNKCVGLANAGSTANGTELVLWDCHKHADQWWTVDPGTHLLHSLAGQGRCVGLADAGSTKNGTHLVVWDCHGRADQRWQLLDDYTVRSLAAPDQNKCVGLANAGSTANGTPLVLWDCHKHADQRWKRGA